MPASVEYSSVLLNIMGTRPLTKYIRDQRAPERYPGQPDHPMPGGKSSRTKGRDSKISKVA